MSVRRRETESILQGEAQAACNSIICLPRSSFHSFLKVWIDNMCGKGGVHSDRCH